MSVAEQWHKAVIKKFKRKKVYASLKDNIKAVDLAEIKSLSDKKKFVRYLLCIVDVFTKYAWIKTLKDEKGKSNSKCFYRNSK